MVAVQVFQSNMNVFFTPAFTNHLSKVYPGNTTFLLTIKKVGCNGFAYDISPYDVYGDSYEEGAYESIWINEDDEIWALVPKEHASVFEGAIFDFVREGLNFKTKVTNPNEKGRCGCGESFNLS